MAQPYQNCINRVQLQEILAIDVDKTGASLEKTVAIGRTGEENTHGLTEKLMENRQFRNWFQSKNSQFLLLRAVGTDNVFPLSSFCAMLVSSLKNVRPAITIHYFCGVLRMNGIEGEHHLIRCLLSQLLEYWPREHLLPSHLDIGRLHNQDFETLWLLFVAAITSFEGATIFCTIDGLLRYPREEEAILTVHRLGQLSESLLQSVTFKVLVTSPVPPRLKDSLPGSNQVIVDTDTSDRIDSNVGQGLNPIIASQFATGNSGSRFQREPLNIL